MKKRHIHCLDIDSCIRKNAALGLIFVRKSILLDEKWRFSVSITLLKSTNFAENRDPEAHSLFRESLKEIEKYIEG